MSTSPHRQALIKLTCVRHPQVWLEQAAMTMMMVPGYLHLAPDQQLVHRAEGAGVQITGEDHGAVLSRQL